jgi:hypothetical protein
VRLGVQDKCFSEPSRINLQAWLPPKTRRYRIRADATEQISNGFGVANRTKLRLNSRSGKGRKKVLQVHSQDDVPAYVGTYERFDGSSFDEPVHCGMWRDFVENFGQNLLL